jgi:hypothetical protein
MDHALDTLGCCGSADFAGVAAVYAGVVKCCNRLLCLACGAVGLSGCDNLSHSQAAVLSVASSSFSKSIFKIALGDAAMKKRLLGGRKLFVLSCIYASVANAALQQVVMMQRSWRM